MNSSPTISAFRVNFHLVVQWLNILLHTYVISEDMFRGCSLYCYPCKVILILAAHVGVDRFLFCFQRLV